MFSTPRSLRFSSCFFSLLFSSASLLAQDHALDRTPGARSMGASLGVTNAFPLVKNRPYTAIVRTQQLSSTPAGDTVLYESIDIRMRDSAGRVRSEAPGSPIDSAGGFTQHMVTVIDPVSMHQAQWNFDTHSSYSAPLPASLALDNTPRLLSCDEISKRQDPLHPQDVVKYQNLGYRDIAGVRAEGCRITRIEPKRNDGIWYGTVITEAWVSTDLQLLLQLDERSSDGRESVMNTTRITLAEPDPALFRNPLQ